MDPRLSELFPKSFDARAWDLVKTELRPELVAAVMGEDWNRVSEIWKEKRFLVERAVS
jgi:hypothetical protein